TSLKSSSYVLKVRPGAGRGGGRRTSGTARPVGGSGRPFYNADFPILGRAFVGREGPEGVLQEAARTGTVRFVSIVGWAGSGKTTVLRHWLEQGGVADPPHPFHRVFAWSFSEETGRGGEPSSEGFLAEAARYFGIADALGTEMTAVAKGEMIAE